MARLRDTLMLRLYTLLKIPLVAWVRPVVERLDEDACVMRIPLGRRTRNHLRSMYFGALCIGADAAGGLIMMRLLQRSKEPYSFVFKDFKADFLRRAEGDVLFTCEDGPALRALMERARTSGRREEETVTVLATCPSRLGEEPVARFELTLSIKQLG